MGGSLVASLAVWEPKLVLWDGGGYQGSRQSRTGTDGSLGQAAAPDLNSTSLTLMQPIHPQTKPDMA